MGLFDFVRDAGEKIFGKDDDKPPAKQQPGAKPGTPAPGRSPERPSREPPDRPELGRPAREGARLNCSTSTGSASPASRSTSPASASPSPGRSPTQEVREKVILVLGNTAGVAQVDDRLVVERKEPEAQFYTVKSGDTLSKIAKQYYGNASKYPTIFEANRPMLQNPDKIYPGQVLRIPGWPRERYLQCYAAVRRGSGGRRTRTVPRGR